MDSAGAPGAERLNSLLLAPALVRALDLLPAEFGAGSAHEQQRHVGWLETQDEPELLRIVRTALELLDVVLPADVASARAMWGAVEAWEESWRAAAEEGDVMRAVQLYVGTSPLAATVAGAPQLAQHLAGLAGELAARLRAPPDPAAAERCITAMRALVEGVAEGLQGGWYTASLPPIFHNLHSRMQRLMLFLSYAPRYAARHVAGPDEPAAAASPAHPGDRQQWLFSYHMATLLFKVALITAGGDEARAARAWTYQHVEVPGLGTVRGSRPLPQCQFSDMARHNAAVGGYRAPLPDGSTVVLPGRLPRWPTELPRHLAQLLAMDEHADIGRFIGIIMESGTHGRDFWAGMPGTVDVTAPVQAAAEAVLRAAGLDDAADAQRFLGLRGSRPRRAAAATWCCPPSTRAPTSPSARARSTPWASSTRWRPWCRRCCRACSSCPGRTS